MKFSIVTPVRNGMPWLPACVASVAAQRADVELEHLILDALSTDGTREWLEANQHLGYRFASERDAGMTDALIKGFAATSGEILGWLNADDLFEPGALRTVASVFAERPSAAMVGGVCLVIDETGKIIGTFTTPPGTTRRELLLRLQTPPQPATFFSRAAYERVGGLDRRYHLAMDVDLFIRLPDAGDVVWLADTILARFRRHAGSQTTADMVSAAKQDLQVRRRLGMPMRSHAGIALLKAIYVDRFQRATRGAIRGLLLRSAAR